MKIVYTIHQFFPHHYTGTERYLLNMAKMMKKFGHDVQVITYMPLVFDKNECKIDGIVATKEYMYENIKVTGVRLLEKDAAIPFDLEHEDLNKFFLKFLEKEKPDIFHITHPMRLPSAFFASKKLKIKTVITLTDYWMMCGLGTLLRMNNTPCMSPKNGENCKKYCYPDLPIERLRNRVEVGRKMFKKADALIASAHFLANLFKMNEYDTSKLNLIRHSYNYFDGYEPITKKANKHFTFSCVGSLAPHKGADLLIEAFKIIKNENIRLRIYGEPQAPDYFKHLKMLKGNDKRISFEGKYTIAQTAQIHKKTDVIVQPSVWYETYPLVGVASLAYGVPLIVPDTTGAAELVTEGETGYIFKFADVDSLAEKMNLAIKDNLKLTKTISYPHTVEGEAYLTQAVYYKVLAD